MPAELRSPRYDSRDLSRSSFPCTVPYRNRAQWRIANAVKVTHVRHGRVHSNTSPSSPLVLPGVPAGHVARFSPPSPYPSSSDRGNDLPSVVRYALYRFHAIADDEFDRSCRRPHLIAISSPRISSRAIPTFRCR